MSSAARSRGFSSPQPNTAPRAEAYENMVLEELCPARFAHHDCSAAVIVGTLPWEMQLLWRPQGHRAQQTPSSFH